MLSTIFSCLLFLVVLDVQVNRKFLDTFRSCQQIFSRWYYILPFASLCGNLLQPHIYKVLYNYVVTVLWLMKFSLSLSVVVDKFVMLLVLQ